MAIIRDVKGVARTYVLLRKGTKVHHNIIVANKYNHVELDRVSHYTCTYAPE